MKKPWFLSILNGQDIKKPWFFSILNGPDIKKHWFLSILKGPLQMHWAHSAIIFDGVTRFELILKPVSWPYRDTSREAFPRPSPQTEDLLIGGGWGEAAAEGPGNDVGEDERATMQ